MIAALAQAFLWPLAAVALASSAYVATLTAFAGLTLARRRRPALPGHPRTRFALLVPAHDEETVIGRLLQSLSRLDYPKGMVEVFVIADNCADATEARARAAGAKVLVRSDAARPGKGYALAWALERIDLACYDAVVMVDADSALDPAFLLAADARLRDGAEIVQGYYGVLNDGSTAAALRSVSFALMHYVRPLGKALFGGASGLKGNGMAFSTELLLSAGWQSFSVVEDAEQGLRLAYAGHFVQFAPEARVYGEMPSSLAGARTQNLRWEAGRWSVARRWCPRLLWRGLSRRSLPLIDAAIEPLVPPLSVVAALGPVAGLAGLLLDNMALTIVGGASLGGIAAHVLGGMLLARSPLSAWRSLFAAPVYLAWKVALYGQALLGSGAQRWVRTPRAPSKR
jgi:cellulose synthase/poly-beta-1,6-N-acetylglucosamine synthase-like glycosyltransferase